MLRSYQYTETPYVNYSMQEDVFREKEVAIAYDFVKNHKIRRESRTSCPICGKGNGHFFYNKWNVDYLKCDNCKSIFTVVDEQVIKEYRNLKSLREMRLESEYQNNITAKRTDYWQGLIDWIQVRAYRFLKRNRDLAIVDVGNRFEGFSEQIRHSDLCGEYNLRKSILMPDEETIAFGKADLVFYFDQLQGISNPEEILKLIRDYLTDDGILYIGNRAGSGFDILTLKDKNNRIFPYEHILLPSIKGLIDLFDRLGFEVLEVTTPGVMDVKYVLDGLKYLEEETFVRDFMEDASQGVLQEFQRFLQKSGRSSFVSLLVKKKSLQRKADYV